MILEGCLICIVLLFTGFLLGSLYQRSRMRKIILGMKASLTGPKDEKVFEVKSGVFEFISNCNLDTGNKYMNITNIIRLGLIDQL